MQDVETAIGEADAQTLPAPLREPFVHHACQSNRIFSSGAERGRRQDARAQFARPKRSRCRCLPTTTAAAALAARMAGFETGFERQHRRQHRDHGVAGARHVADLHRISRHMNRRRVLLHQRHALVAAGHQHRLAGERLAQFVGGGRHILVAAHLAAHGVAQFLAVGRDQRGAAIDAEIAALGIDHHRLAGLLARRRAHGG